LLFRNSMKHRKLRLSLMHTLLDAGVLILVSLAWCGLAQAQGLRCVDEQGRVSYVGAGVSAAGACTPLNLQASSPGPREESRDRAVEQRNGALQATGQEKLCAGSITRVLHAPGTARFTLTPSGPNALAGHVDVQNRSGAYVRREVWCEFSPSGTLQHAFVEQDPAVLRETVASK